MTDTGEMHSSREDFIGRWAHTNRTAGGVLERLPLRRREAGLEIFDLRNVRAGGSAPALVSRTPGLHYRRLAVNGTTLAGLFPSTDLPCYPTGTSFCFNTVDLFDISNRTSPHMVGQISSSVISRTLLGFNDIAFNQGFLYMTGEGGTVGFNVGNPAAPSSLGQFGVAGKFLASNDSSLLAVGNAGQIDLYSIGLNGSLSHFSVYTLPYETINRANPIMFHPQAFIDDQNGRMVTMVDELDPQTLNPARTIAIDVFDFTVPLYEGSDQRIYENVSYTMPDEVKYNPVAVGPFVYVVGSMSGLQTLRRVRRHGRHDSNSTARSRSLRRRRDPRVGHRHAEDRQRRSCSSTTDPSAPRRSTALRAPTSHRAHRSTRGA